MALLAGSLPRPWRVELLEVRVAVEDREVGVAAGPGRVLPARLLGLAKGLEALRKAWDAGFKDPSWARRDPDLALLHGDPEFERLYPAGTAEGGR